MDLKSKKIYEWTKLSFEVTGWLLLLSTLKVLDSKSESYIFIILFGILILFCGSLVCSIVDGFLRRKIPIKEGQRGYKRFLIEVLDSIIILCSMLIALWIVSVVEGVILEMVNANMTVV